MKIWMLLVILYLGGNLVMGSDVWMALYSAEECLNSALQQDNVVIENECIPTTLSDGTEASVKFICSGDGEASSWSAGVYYGSSCFGFKIMTLTAEDACTCGSSSIFGYSISAYANCAGTAPSCFLNPTDPKVWGAVYSAADCDSQSLILDTTVVYGDCIGGVLPDGTAVSSKFVCHGHTADSSWETGLYLTDDCTGIKVLSLGASDSCTCASTSLLGYADVSAYANCEGVRPDCFDKYPTDDKYDDVTETPIVLTAYSSPSCAIENEIGSLNTINGIDGCMAFPTAMGDIGLVVYCDINDLAYRVEMFASTSCSEDPFTFVVGTADTCVDVVGVGSLIVDCGTDSTTNGGGGSNSQTSDTENAILAVLAAVFATALIVVTYCCYCRSKDNKTSCDFRSAVSNTVEKFNKYEDL